MSELIENFSEEIVLSVLITMKGKRIREKGKIRLSSYFKNLNKGEKVSIVPDAGVRSAFPRRIRGKTATVLDSRGSFKVVEIKEGSGSKKYIIHPIHLRKI